MKFAKDSIEWGIFGAVWKFYQHFYEPEPGITTAEWLNAMAEGRQKIVEPLKGKQQYNLADFLLTALCNEICDRYEKKWKEEHKQ